MVVEVSSIILIFWNSFYKTITFFEGSKVFLLLVQNNFERFFFYFHTNILTLMKLFPTYIYFYLINWKKIIKNELRHVSQHLLDLIWSIVSEINRWFFFLSRQNDRLSAIIQRQSCQVFAGFRWAHHMLRFDGVLCLPLLAITGNAVLYPSAVFLFFCLLMYPRWGLEILTHLQLTNCI